jgi:hypothetical protein
MTQPVNQGVRLPGALGRLQTAIAGPSKAPVEQLPKSVGGGFGNVPAAPIDTTKEPAKPRVMSPAQAQQLMQAELIAAVRSLTEASTELAGRLGRRGSVNGVLESWAGTIPASGIITRTYEVAAGSMSLENLSAANIVTISSGVSSTDTGGPTAGTGVSYARPNSRCLAPLADHSITITGTPGDKVSFEVFTGLQPYGVNS